MSEFKVGDLVECQEGFSTVLTKGKTYTVLKYSCEFGEKYVKIKNDEGVNGPYFATRFKLAEPSLKVGDKVKSQKYGIEGFVFEIVGNAVFVECCNGICTQKLSDLEKVEEKTAPPKFTKVFVWNGDCMPEFPAIRRSSGKMENGKLILLAEDYDHGATGESSVRYIRNWMVIE